MNQRTLEEDGGAFLGRVYPSYLMLHVSNKRQDLASFSVL